MFILDTRGREESVEQLIEDIKKGIVAAGAEVNGVENLGRRDFARVTDAQMIAANYVEFTIAGSPGAATRVREQFRLNPIAYRVLVQSI
jgi:small subunit ribosomal protein S6